MKSVKSTLVAVIFAVAVAALGAGIVPAQSCQALVSDLVSYTSTPVAGGENVVHFKLTGNRGASDWAQYAEGTLHYRPGRFVGWLSFPPSLSGDAEQFFSDRTWQFPGEVFTSHPFNPNATDKLRLSFDISPWSANYGRMTYTLLSWGNAHTTSDPQCASGYLYGFLNDQMYVITFKKDTIYFPK
ncbi:MAG TPA: hypothetical protein VFD58_08805 [Blastocatellia bacterium]|nr:hypothetical protein [Blastocatellia bacterium]